MSDLLCKKCKYAKWRPWHVFSWRCTAVLVPEKTEMNPVTGPETTPAHYDSCSFQRMRSGHCGPNGKLWQPKSKKYFFLAIKHSERQL